MASNEAPIEGYGEAVEPTSNYSDDDVPEHDPSEDGPIAGTVVDIHSGEDENGPWHRVKMMTDEDGLKQVWAKWDFKTAINEGRVSEGDDVCVWVDEDTTERFTNDDGDVIQKNPHRWTPATEGSS